MEIEKVLKINTIKDNMGDFEIGNILKRKTDLRYKMDKWMSPLHYASLVSFVFISETWYEPNKSQWAFVLEHTYILVGFLIKISVRLLFFAINLIQWRIIDLLFFYAFNKYFIIRPALLTFPFKIAFQNISLLHLEQKNLGGFN